MLAIAVDRDGVLDSPVGQVTTAHHQNRQCAPYGFLVKKK